MAYWLALYERLPGHQGPRIWEWQQSAGLAT